MLLLPPAPAALVLAGRAFATLSALSAAAFLLIAVAGPPGAFGEAGRAVVEAVVGELTGDEGSGDDYAHIVRTVLVHCGSPSPMRMCASLHAIFIAFRSTCESDALPKVCSYHVAA